ncbi:MAG: hypothetical protein Q4B09_09375 [Lachnospiraceae bacterium]|nr:hypothetical protein [Lachnospiraceae bacterium]
MRKRKERLLNKMLSGLLLSGILAISCAAGGATFANAAEITDAAGSALYPINTRGTEGMVSYDGEYTYLVSTVSAVGNDGEGHEVWEGSGAVYRIGEDKSDEAEAFYVTREHWLNGAVVSNGSLYVIESWAENMLDFDNVFQQELVCVSPESGDTKRIAFPDEYVDRVTSFIYADDTRLYLSYNYGRSIVCFDTETEEFEAFQWPEAAAGDIAAGEIRYPLGIYEGYLYYLKGAMPAGQEWPKMENGLWRISLDGSEEELITRLDEDSVSELADDAGFWVQGELLVYLSEDWLLAVDIATGDIYNIAEVETRAVTIDGDSVYYLADENLYCWHPGDSEPECRITNDAGVIRPGEQYFLGISGNWLYFSDYDYNRMYRVRKDASVYPRGEIVNREEDLYGGDPAPSEGDAAEGTGTESGDEMPAEYAALLTEIKSAVFENGFTTAGSSHNYEEGAVLALGYSQCAEDYFYAKIYDMGQGGSDLTQTIYTLLDLDGDGEKELLLSAADDNVDCIYDIIDGQLTTVDTFVYRAEGRVRGNLIEASGSGGAMLYSTAWYSYLPGGERVFEDGTFEDYEKDPQIYWRGQTYSEDAQPLTEEEYRSIQDQYNAMESPEWKMLADF